MVDNLLQDRDTFLADVRKRRQQAQAYTKQHYDNHHCEPEFDIGDWV